MAECASFALVWLVTYLLHSSALYGLAWALERLRWLRAPALREQLWRAAMLGALVTASVQSTGCLPRLGLGFAWPPASARAPLEIAAAPAASGALANASTSPSAAPRAAQSAHAPELSRTQTPASQAAPIPLRAASGGGVRGALARAAAWLEGAAPAALLALWLAGAAWLALRLAALGWLARAQLGGRRAPSAALDGEWRALCAAHPPTRARLSIADRLEGPVSLPNGEVVVPPWTLEELSARQRRAMLAHELAHQLRRDPQWLVLAQLLSAFLWLQPLNRLARARLSALAELEADAWAARSLGDPRALAECLAECAERMHARRAPLFGAAMVAQSPLLERVDRLLEGIPMQVRSSSWRLRAGLCAGLLAALFVLPGCDEHWQFRDGNSVSISVSHSDDGTQRVEVRRAGYALDLRSSGLFGLTEDETDLAQLAPKGHFELSETLAGVERSYRVEADAGGALTRRFRLDGTDVPADEASRSWLAAALPRMLRESGLDAPARVARLLARGGPEAVIDEAAQCGTDHARASYLGLLLGSAELGAQQCARALEAARQIESDYELRQVLAFALEHQPADAEHFGAALAAAQELESDHELAELLTSSAERAPLDRPAREAWLAAARGLDSDYELRRTLEAGYARFGQQPDFARALLALASERLHSDFELRNVLTLVAERAADPELAAAYLASARQLGSDYERRCALLLLLERTQLDARNLRALLDAAEQMSSDFETRGVLEAAAPQIGADADLNRRYREVARGLGDFERGAALRALDDHATY